MYSIAYLALGALLLPVTAALNKLNLELVTLDFNDLHKIHLDTFTLCFSYLVTVTIFKDFAV